jgi:hypothetical protein
MLNYSSNYYNYLVGEQQNDLSTVIFREVTKLGTGKIWNWTNRDFMEWIYQILPQTDPDSETSKEDDINQVVNNTSHEGGGKPMWQVYDKFKDQTAYEVRAGKKSAPEPHD